MRSIEGASRAARVVDAPTRPKSVYPSRRKLAIAAQERGVELELMPVGMQRQKENTSYYDARRKRIAWRVELMFPHFGIHHTEAAVPETASIHSILARLLMPDTEQGSETPAAPHESTASVHASSTARNCAQSKVHQVEDGQRRFLRHRLRAYSRAGLHNLTVLMAVHQQPANDPRYYRLSLDETLGEALCSRVVLEYPALHIILPEEARSAYPLLEEKV